MNVNNSQYLTQNETDKRWNDSSQNDDSVFTLYLDNILGQCLENLDACIENDLSDSEISTVIKPVENLLDGMILKKEEDLSKLRNKQQKILDNLTMKEKQAQQCKERQCVKNACRLITGTILLENESEIIGANLNKESPELFQFNKNTPNISDKLWNLAIGNRKN